MELEVSLIVYRNEYTPSVDATAASTHTHSIHVDEFFFFSLEAADVENRPEAEILYFFAFLFTACFYNGCCLWFPFI